MDTIFIYSSIDGFTGIRGVFWPAFCESIVLYHDRPVQDILERVRVRPNMHNIMTISFRPFLIFQKPALLRGTRRTRNAYMASRHQPTDRSAGRRSSCHPFGSEEKNLRALGIRISHGILPRNWASAHCKGRSLSSGFYLTSLSCIEAQ